MVGVGAGRRGSRAPQECWTARRTWSENDCTSSSQSTTPSIHSRHAAPPVQKNLHLHWANARSTRLQPPDSIPLQMTRHQQDGPRYRISMTTCPFLRLPACTDPNRLGSIRNRSHFAFPASRANLDPSTQRPNGMSKPLLKDLGRMSERVVLRIFDFIVVTHLRNCLNRPRFPVRYILADTPFVLPLTHMDCFRISVLDFRFHFRLLYYLHSVGAGGDSCTIHRTGEQPGTTMSYTSWDNIGYSVYTHVTTSNHPGIWRCCRPISTLEVGRIGNICNQKLAKPSIVPILK